MDKREKSWKRRGFTLIELIVVMAVIGILVLLAAPRFIGQTKEATFTKHISNAKVLEDASERYYIDHGKWPRGLDEDVYTAEEVDAYAERIYDITGKEIVLEEGNYWDIDYSALSSYANLPDESERANYVLRNPVGKVYYLEGLTEAGMERKPTQAIVVDDRSNAPGAKTLVAGNMQAGYFGAIHEDELINSMVLARTIGIPGFYPTTANKNDTWLKFAYKGNIQYVSKKTIKYYLSWNDINKVDAVFGNRTIEIDGEAYKVRLMDGSVGGEWDQLMYPLHETYNDWRVGFTNKDLNLVSTQLGHESLTQDVRLRGRDGVNGNRAITQSSSHGDYGWRPVLELVQ